MNTGTRPAAAKPARRLVVPHEARLELLAPGMQTAAREVLALMQADGHDPIVFETMRTRERVWFLYGKGRTAEQCALASVPTAYAWPECPDGVVTKANRLEDTVHAYGLAFDVICRARRWNATSAFWEALRKACSAAGLFWAGRWPTLPDRPHCQIGAWTRGPSVWARHQLLAGDLAAVHQRLGVS